MEDTNCFTISVRLPLGIYEGLKTMVRVDKIGSTPAGLARQIITNEVMKYLDKQE